MKKKTLENACTEAPVRRIPPTCFFPHEDFTTQIAIAAAVPLITMHENIRSVRKSRVPDKHVGAKRGRNDDE